jgi:hypothetical protein
MAERALDVAQLIPVATLLAGAAKGLVLADLGRLDDAAAEVAAAEPSIGPTWYLASCYHLHLAATVGVSTRRSRRRLRVFSAA